MTTTIPPSSHTTIAIPLSEMTMPALATTAGNSLRRLNFILIARHHHRRRRLAAIITVVRRSRDRRLLRLLQQHH
jgi:cyanophycinase-like exopeptidase